MPLITAETPSDWNDLEELVAAILNECGMTAARGVTLTLPRGSVDVDVVADEIVAGIKTSTLCECKNWQARVPREVVHAFRTVMAETGSHRGYIISKAGFQTGAVDAAKATNIELVTFSEFQNLYFEKWISRRILEIEEDIGDFCTYYEPFGPPGYSQLKSEESRAAYDRVWDKYLFAGLMLQPFSPFLRMGPNSYPFPQLPFAFSSILTTSVGRVWRDFVVPSDIRVASGYREFLALLQGYARAGLAELRSVNPMTRSE